MIDAGDGMNPGSRSADQLALKAAEEEAGFGFEVEDILGTMACRSRSSEARFQVPFSVGGCRMGNGRRELLACDGDCQVIQYVRGSAVNQPGSLRNQGSRSKEGCCKRRRQISLKIATALAHMEHAVIIQRSGMDVPENYIDSSLPHALDRIQRTLVAYSPHFCCIFNHRPPIFQLRIITLFSPRPQTERNVLTKLSQFAFNSLALPVPSLRTVPLLRDEPSTRNEQKSVQDCGVEQSGGPCCRRGVWRLWQHIHSKQTLIPHRSAKSLLDI